jgi:hypothetical protein
VDKVATLHVIALLLVLAAALERNQAESPESQERAERSERAESPESLAALAVEEERQ